MIDRGYVIRKLQDDLEKAEKDGYLYVEIHMTKPIVFDIINMLKEQEAVEPDTDSEGTCSCGNCGETVGYFSAGWSTPLKFYKFCPMCGRMVKWE